ncbi:MAG: hypothetical protein ACP5T3_01030 [Candidatus Micrarchaeia archaeon]
MDELTKEEKIKEALIRIETKIDCLNASLKEYIRAQKSSDDIAEKPKSEEKKKEKV